MPPRYQSTLLSFEEKLRNLADLAGQPGHRGHARIGAGLNRGGTGSLIEIADTGAEAASAAKLLVLSASTAGIASGGDYVGFDAIVAEYGWDDVTPAADGYWVHPISGVYLLTYEHAWDTYDGGGTIRLELDGSLVPEGVIASGSSGQSGRGAIAYAATAGQVGRIKVTQSSGAEQTCSGTLHVAITDPNAEPATEPSELTLLETFYVDTAQHSVAAGTSAASTTVLANGTTYTLVIDGNYSWWINSTRDYGTPDEIMYPSPAQADRPASIDADVIYADISNNPLPRHTDTGGRLMLNLGSGFSHIEPDGGPFSTYDAAHSYTYTVTGEGAVLRGAIDGDGTGASNGMLRVRIYEGG